MYCDRRLAGQEKWYFERPEDYMQIPDEVRQCVAFIGYRKADGRYVLAGTGFFIARGVPGLPEGMGFTYLITAAHVIAKIRDKGINVLDL